MAIKISEALARQFAFVRGGNDELAAFEGWRTYALPQGWALHAHPGAAVQILSAAPEAPVIRIGHAFNLDASGETGAGRFALLKWPEIFSDVGVLQSLYHGARGALQVVASCPEVAARALGGLPPLIGAAPLDHRSPFNYIPAPGAPYQGLRKLLHDQKIDLAEFRVSHHLSPIGRLASHEAALGVLVDELRQFTEELRARIPGTVYLPLTAGLDSRTIAAAFLACGLPFETVTLDYCGKPCSDVTIARAISRRLGVRHRTIRLDPPCPETAARFAEHTAGVFLDWDHTHIVPGDGYRYLGPDDAMIVGSCFEIGRQLTGETRFKGFDFADATGLEVWMARAGQVAPPAYAALLDEWIAWRRAHPLDMDFAAAFYLDQRIGGWRAGLEQGYDLLPGISLCPANNPKIYSAMITPSLSDQREGRLQREAIGFLAPELLGFPINPVPLRVRARKLRRRLRAGFEARIGGFFSSRLGAVPGE